MADRTLRTDIAAHSGTISKWLMKLRPGQSKMVKAPSGPTLDYQGAVGYPYQPLNRRRREIRLLEFSETFDVDHSGPLRCSMVVIPLSKRRCDDHSAVSWCWGDSSERETILIDGHEVQISKTAERALRHLHSQHSPTTDDGSQLNTRRKHRLWLDHVCINQTDLEERAQQVRLMADIYFRARQVLVWLGESDRTTEAAVASIRTVMAQCRSEIDNLSGLYQYLYPTGSGMRLSDKPLPTNIHWDAIRTFYSSPWFSRLWIVQEAALADRAYCFRGLHCLDLMDVAVAAMWMFCHRYWTLTANIEGLEHCQYIFDLRINGDVKHKEHEGDCRLRGCMRPLSLESLLLHVSVNRSSSDPKDKVYGILGLAKSKTAQRVVVDYDLPLVHIYATATLRAIEESQRLDVFREAGSRGGRDSAWYSAKQWPTWVPLFDQPMTKQDPFRLPHPLHSASMDFAAAVTMETCGPYHLKVKGVQVGHVERVSSVLLKHQTAKHYRRAIRKLWQSYKNMKMPDVYESRMTLEEVFSLTLVAGHDHNLDEIDKDRLAQLRFTQMLRRMCSEFEKTTPQDASLKDLSKTGNPHQNRSARSTAGQRSISRSQMRSLPVHINKAPDGLLESRQRKVNGTGRHDAISRSFDMPSSTVGEPGRAVAEAMCNGMDDTKFLEAVSYTASNRCFFITKRGYMGIGSRETRVGDAICILYGGSNPFILRRSTGAQKGGTFELLGECYVQGMMEGEMIADMEARGILEEHSQVFILS